MTFDTLLKALKDNPTAQTHYSGLVTNMLNNDSVIVDTVKTDGADFFLYQTVFSNDCQIDVYLSDRKDGTREIAIAQYSNISDEFCTDIDNAWTVQTK
tara:strand:- start:6 stop:299 length:294 start_codon:yes stop_codon:yes gene_type:complete